MSPEADIVIAGAGCAGLSLAVALADAAVPGRVLLLEPRAEYIRDRTWCFWDTEVHPFTAAISHAWSSWRVGTDRQLVKQESSKYNYCHIAGDDFYRLALARLQREPNTELCRSVRVTGVAAEANGFVSVRTDCGQVLARHVFDSRPPTGAGRPLFLQRFLGWHVRAGQPCFDSQTVELMRFLPSGVPGRLRFLYALPFSSTEALVEMTYLDDPSLPEPDYEADLRAWLREQTSTWEVLYTERGSLPMGGGEAAVELPPRVHPIGTAGGRLKSSSGYGFMRIQRHSRSIAEALRQGRPIPTAAESPFYELMDAVFLEALRHDPDSGPELFTRMFERAEPDALVRFLSERSSSPAEVLRVAWTLPKLPMARAAFSAASKRKGRP